MFFYLTFPNLVHRFIILAALPLFFVHQLLFLIYLHLPVCPEYLPCFISHFHTTPKSSNHPALPLLGLCLPASKNARRMEATNPSIRPLLYLFVLLPHQIHPCFSLSMGRLEDVCHLLFISISLSSCSLLSHVHTQTHGSLSLILLWVYFSKGRSTSTHVLYFSEDHRG